MNAQEYIQAGRLDEALAALQSEVRNQPADAKLRTFLFQLLCVLGQWERAMTQLKVLSAFNSETMMLARVFEPLVNCEVLRAEVFQGKRTPIIFGEPLEWIGLLSQANELLAKGKFSAAQELREKAFAAAPTTSGKVNEKPFEWIADADLRLGPMLEAVVEGHYYWIPFCRIKRLYTEPPSDLRDLVWAPAQFLWVNGGEACGHIPTRYPGTETSGDPQLRLARKTEWVEQAEGLTTGLGQRIFATDTDDYPLLECRTIDLVHAD